MNVISNEWTKVRRKDNNGEKVTSRWKEFVDMDVHMCGGGTYGMTKGDVCVCETVVC